MPAVERDWVSDPSVRQRIVLALLAIAPLALGAAFLVPAVWSLSDGSFCGGCLLVGYPAIALGAVLGSAAALPVGRPRDTIMTITMVLFASSLAVFVVLALTKPFLR